MISHKGREMRKEKTLKMSKNIERIYKEGKCRDCSVVVTRMDFAKILGKFTKVKIQYESTTTTKAKKDIELSPNSNSRLKSNENGMVLIHRNSYNQHPVKELFGSKKVKKNNEAQSSSPRQANNILKENNRLKKSPIVKDKNSNYNQQNQVKNNSNLKQYGIIFINPNINLNNDVKSKISLSELLPDINKSLLPSDEWSIDYFPKNDEPKDDKVYDRIAAELEDLMFNEKASNASDKADVTEKVDEFPSIMDILNENTTESIPKPDDQSTLEFKPNLESSDVEAMLLGKAKSSTVSKESKPTLMEVDNSDMSNLIGDVEQLNTIQRDEPQVSSDKPEEVTMNDNNYIQENSEKDIGALSSDNVEKDGHNVLETLNMETNAEVKNTEINEESKTISDTNPLLKTETITHVVFKQTINGKCLRCVTCPKNLKYSIEFDGKTVEFIGAPKFISSLEDLEVLLQIVNESQLDSLYVLH